MANSRFRLSSILVCAIVLSSQAAIKAQGVKAVEGTTPTKFEEYMGSVASADVGKLADLQQAIESDQSLPMSESFALLTEIARQYREKNDMVHAKQLAATLIEKPFFQESKLARSLAWEWRHAAYTYFVASDMQHREEFMSRIEHQLDNKSTSAILRLEKLGLLLDTQVKLMRTARSREIVERTYPPLLSELKADPSADTIYAVWRLDIHLAEARIPSKLRVETLEWCLKTSEEAILQKPDFDGRHFPNSLNLRETLARLYSQMGREPDAIRSLAHVDQSLWTRFKTSLRREAVDEASFESAIARLEESWSKRSRKLEDLATNGSSSLVGKPMPTLTPSLAIDDSFAKVKSNVLLLEFWAVWCGPCIQTMPDLSELQRKYANRSFSVVGITKQYGYQIDAESKQILRAANQAEVRRDAEILAVREFCRKHEITFPQMLDDGSLTAAFGVTSLPTTIVIDSAGVIQYVGSISSTPQYERVDALISRLVSEGEK